VTQMPLVRHGSRSHALAAACVQADGVVLHLFRCGMLHIQHMLSMNVNLLTIDCVLVLLTVKHCSMALALCRYATILVPSLLTAPRYFAGEIEFGVIAQVRHCCSSPRDAFEMFAKSIATPAMALQH
jgi:hypothetical protein